MKKEKVVMIDRQKVYERALEMACSTLADWAAGQEPQLPCPEGMGFEKGCDGCPYKGGDTITDCFVRMALSKAEDKVISLKDKNGKDIYEGDILKVVNPT